MDCQGCKHGRLREESALAMAERTIRRLWITNLVLIVAIVGLCVGFFVYESQFEDYSSVEWVDIDADQEGDYNFLSGGDLYYGTESTHNESDYDKNTD